MIVNYFNYYKSGSILQNKPNSEIDDDILDALIRSNPNEEKINKLRVLPYLSVEYQALKESLPFITVHAVYKGVNRKRESFNGFTGILFFDVDKKDMDKMYPEREMDIEEMKKMILKKHNSHIYRMGTSIGGRGIFFHLKIKNPQKLSLENFKRIHHYYRTVVFDTLPIDKKVNDIERIQFVTSDKELYVNKKAVTTIPSYLFNDSNKDNDEKVSKNSLADKRCGTVYNVLPVEAVYNEPNLSQPLKTTLPFPIISIAELIDGMVTETPNPLANDFEQEAIVQEMPYARIQFKQRISTGRRHSTFKKLMHHIIHLNPTWTEQKIFSYLNYVNDNNCIEPLKQKDLYRTFCNYLEIVKNEGVRVGAKKVWTNPNSKKRREIANRLNGEIRKGQLLAGVKIVVEEIIPAGVKVTQKTIAQNSYGRIKIDRVKSNWPAIKTMLAELPIKNRINS